MRLVWTPIGLLLTALVAMWIVEVIDTVLLSDRLQANGIGPRRIAGLDGILWAPFLHSDYGHLVSNTTSLLALGSLLAPRGLRYWVRTSIVVVLVGGTLTWAMAGGANHIGASGLSFGYLGAIIGAAVFERRPRAMAPALIVLGFYSGMLVGLVPQDAISWEGHLFGMLSGIGVALWLAEPRPAADPEEYEPEPWELDEPWLG